MQKTSTQQFEHILRSVREAIAKSRLVENVTRHQNQGPRQTVVEDLVRRQQHTHLNRILKALHPADLALVIENLSADERQLVWQLQAPSRGGDLLLELPDSIIPQLIEASDARLLKQITRQLDADDLSFLAEWLPQDLLEARRAELSSDEQAWVKQSLQFPEDSVGSLMTNEMTVVHEQQALHQVIDELRAQESQPEQNDKLLVTDRRGHLVGVLPWQALVLNDPQQTVAEVMAREVVAFKPEESAAQAARAFERYNLVSAPVIGARGRPIGRLTVDDVMDFVRDDMSEDALNAAGLKGEEDLFAPVWASARNRWLWLSLSLLTAFLASRVIGQFEEVIAGFVALAALMPIVAAIGGNTGNQTTTLVVRGLALAQISSANRGQLIRKELTLSLLNGVVWGGVVGLFALVFYHDVALMLVIAAAMMLTLLLAAVLGLAVPLTLQSMNRDPALGSSVLVTALTDSMGFFIFLGLASIFIAR